MIKVQNNIALREPLPSFLQGLSSESLQDLSWTDPQLGVQDAAWLPEDDQTPPLGENQVLDGTETLTHDAQAKTVIVVRGIRQLTTEEIRARWLVENPVPHEVPRWAGLLALKRHAIEGGDLAMLPAEDAGDSSLSGAVFAYRATMEPGEARDRLDVALNDAKDWMRESPTVLGMCQVLGLDAEQADALFRWAKAQEGSV
jgi:hypothetical protein